MGKQQYYFHECSCHEEECNCHEEECNCHSHHYEHQHDDTMMHDVYACEFYTLWNPIISPDSFHKTCCLFMTQLSDTLYNKGCKLIGHIKLMADAGEQGAMFCSITSFVQQPHCKGSVAGWVGKVDFVLNVIVYGVAIQDIDHAVKACQDRCFADNLHFSEMK